MNKRSQWILAFAIPTGVLVASVGAYVALGPYFTLKRFGDAIAARDAMALAECVDFPKLRVSIKKQIELGVEQRSKALFADNPIASLAAGLATSLSDPLVDSLITPSGFETLLSGNQILSSFGAKSPGSTVRVQGALSNARYEARSLSEFAVKLEPTQGAEVTLLLAREGLDWKIAGVELPQ